MDWNAKKYAQQQQKLKEAQAYLSKLKELQEEQLEVQLQAEGKTLAGSQQASYNYQQLSPTAQGWWTTSSSGNWPALSASAWDASVKKSFYAVYPKWSPMTLERAIALNNGEAV